MKAADIVVGNSYWTNVSGQRVEVKVIFDSGKRGRRYTVERVDNKKLLGARSAAALHVSRHGLWSGAFGP